MEIVKKLNLNKTPKDLENGSIVCAKNMMVDDTGSFLTQDTSLVEAFRCDSGERIVGVIPCGDRIVILTNIPSTGVVEQTSKVYIQEDSGTIHRVYSNWKYEGGTIVGAYTTNYKNEIVLAIAESGANKDVPLKSFIIHKVDSTSPVEGIDATIYDYYTMPNQTYATEEEVPTYKIWYNVYKRGSLVCGTYTFFVRFKLDKDNYTKWFQITTDIHITQEVESNIYKHTYKKGDTKELAAVASTVQVNGDDLSNKSIDITFKEVSKDGEVQIGYIIKRKTDVQSRILGNYTITDGTLSFSVANNNYVEEANRDEMLLSPSQYFNVETLSCYNNRLYLSNYKEYDNTPINPTGIVGPSLSPISPNNNNVVIDGGGYIIGEEVGTEQGSSSESEETTTTLVWEIDLTVKNYSASENWERNETLHLNNIITDEDGYLLTNNDNNQKERFINAFIDCIYKWSLKKDGCKFTTPYSELEPEAYEAGKRMDKYLYISGANASDPAFCIATRSTSPDTAMRSVSVEGWDFTKHDITSVRFIRNTFGRLGEIELTLDTGDIINLFYTSVFGEFDIIYYTDDSRNWYWFGTSSSGLLTSLRNKYSTTTAPRDGVISHNYSNYYESIDGSSDKSSSDITGDGDPNARTMMPLQPYNLFVHYIRKDGSCTLGYGLGLYVFTALHDNGIIIPNIKVSNNPNPDEYVGYFISYEEVDKIVDGIYILVGNNSDTYVKITNAGLLYNVEIVKGNTIKTTTGLTGITPETVDTTLKINKCAENYIEVKGTLVAPCTKGSTALFFSDHGPLYTKESKVLYRLTPNIYSFDTVFTSNEYLPAYLNRQVIVEYIDEENADNKDGILFSGSTEKVYTAINDTEDFGKETTYSVDIHNPAMYSDYPAEAMNVKQDFIRSMVTLSTGSDDNKITENIVNSVISPSDLHDYLELQPAYQAKPDKVYANYQDRFTNRFDKTIRRSDVVSDESLVNGFRHFEPNNYKNILESKGKITNIIGIGLYLLVHTEYSLFVFDRSPQLTQKYQMNIPDTFDIDYQEVLASNEGYGGLQDKEESIVTKNGYIWYDKANKLVFLYVSGKSAILSADINNFIKNVPIKTVRFAEDILHNRVMMCFTQEDDRQFTISFSFETKSFVSLHDYSFTNNYRTYNVSYLFDKSRHANVLYKYDHSMNIAAYGLLKNTPDNNSTHFKFSPEECYVDLIFNEEFHISKVLNSISYVLNKIKDFSSIYNIAEESMNRRYSGYKLQVYTDETASPILDIDSTIDANEQLVEDITRYDRPVWDKGKWIFDYFRNNAMNNSDINSMIFGKYFVVRFIFNKQDRVKLDTIEINSNLY